jgi:hypothetical protein
MRRLISTFAIAISALLNASVLCAQTLTFNRFDTAAIGAPRSIVSGDFNRDGWPDIALGGTERASIGILLNHGAGDGDEGQRFQPLQEIVVGGGPFELAAGDLNRDGFTDIAIANADLNTVTLLFGLDKGQFAPKVDIAVPGNPRGLAIGDFNHDAKPDIIVTKYQAPSLDILFGAGDGTFPARRTLSAPMNAQGVAAADLNNDGWTDAVVVSTQGTVSTYIMTAAGATREDQQRGRGWNVVTTGDVNRDGYIDVVYASTGNSVVEVMFRHPNGSAAWQGDPIPVAASPRGIEAADMNQDGVLDLVVAGRSASMVSVLLANPASLPYTRYSRLDYAAGTGARDVALLEFNNDGRVDIATANETADSATVLQNNTSFVPSGFTFEPKAGPQVYYNAIFGVADFNHNGTPDLVQQNRVLLDGTTVSRHLANSNGGGGPSNGGAAGDFNGDGHPDVVYTLWESFRVFFGDGSGGFTDGPVTTTVGFGSRLRAGDMNRDGRLDIIVTLHKQQAGAFEIWLGQGNGTFVRSAHADVIAQWLEVGDLNRDGLLDTVVSSAAGVSAFIGNGSGGWKAVVPFGESTPRFGFALGDVTEDGILDLVVADGEISRWGPTTTSRLTVARGHGDGSFEVLQQYDTVDPGEFNPIRWLRLGDLNTDGHLDIFTDRGGLLAGSGSGGFGEPQRFAVASLEEGVIADVNGDGLLDVLGFNVFSWSPFGEGLQMLNTRRTPAQNRAPEGIDLPASMDWPYAEFYADHDEPGIWPGPIFDPDLHTVRYRWTLADGTVVSTFETCCRPLPPGTYQVTLTVDDYRGGVAQHTLQLRVTPHKETVLIPAHEGDKHGAWQSVSDSTAAEGARAWHPNANAPKVTGPLPNPTDYIDVGFLADPTQTYKLWLRLKAENDSWANDSVFVQFTGAKDSAGNPIYEIGTASALAVNLEECSGCGISGWGWEDDGWGAVNGNGVTLRFPEGGPQTIRIQTREDGVSIDTIVLSSEKYLTARPGSAKNDTTRLSHTGPYVGPWRDRN